MNRSLTLALALMVPLSLGSVREARAQISNANMNMTGVPDTAKVGDVINGRVSWSGSPSPGAQLVVTFHNNTTNSEGGTAYSGPAKGSSQEFHFKLPTPGKWYCLANVGQRPGSGSQVNAQRGKFLQVEAGSGDGGATLAGKISATGNGGTIQVSLVGGAAGPNTKLESDIFQQGFSGERCIDETLGANATSYSKNVASFMKRPGPYQARVHLIRGGKLLHYVDVFVKK